MIAVYLCVKIDCIIMLQLVQGCRPRENKLPDFVEPR